LKEFFFVALWVTKNQEKVLNKRIVATQDQELAVFRAIGNNDKAAIESVYSENYALIQHFVISNNGTEDDARDIFQEAMMVLYEKSRQNMIS